MRITTFSICLGFIVNRSGRIKRSKSFSVSVKPVTVSVGLNVECLIWN